MSNPIHAAILLLVLLVFVLPAILVARLADRRGRSFAVYLITSLIVGWIVPLILVLLLPNRGHDVSYEE